MKFLKLSVAAFAIMSVQQGCKEEVPPTSAAGGVASVEGGKKSVRADGVAVDPEGSKKKSASKPVAPNAAAVVDA